MKRYFVLFCLAAGLRVSAHADTTVYLDAGQLTGPSGATMQLDDNFPSSNGSLLLLIDLGSSGALDNALTAGNYVAGTNTILAAAGFNNDNGTNETQSQFGINGTTGDVIALRWFPQITYAQFETGTYTPAIGDSFGTYSAGSGAAPDGGSSWLVPNPSAGSTIDLNFFTTNSDGGGSQAPAEGYADFFVTANQTVPEPSVAALLGLGLMGLLAQSYGARSRRNHDSAESR